MPGTAMVADLDEATVVARAQDGDLLAFERLVDDYQTPLYRLALRMVDDRQLAEDVVQDSFVAAWRKLPTLTEPQAFRGWMYQIVTFRSLDLLRRRRSEPLLIDRTGTNGHTLNGQQRSLDPSQQVEQQAQMRGLQQVLSGLPVDQRVCWLLRDVDELSYVEISTVLNLPVSTIRGRLARARRQLSEGMASWR